MTSKTHVIPRAFKGFWKVYGWRSFVEGYSKLGERATHRLWKTVLHTRSDLFKPGQNFSHLLTLVHTCSYLFTPPWLSTLFPQWQFLVEFSPCESCYFSISHAILLKLHVFAHLIESYPTVSGLSSCIEKMSIPQAAHTTVTMYARRTIIFRIFECSYSSVLRPILLKLHILTRLIFSFPTLCGLWSCIEVKLSIPLRAHAWR